jgi:2-oxoisovalerate dehydrogenase E2 component (dihydrolipoyl transacylase)
MGRYVFRLPDVGEGTAEAEIAEWHIKAGDAVKEDQPLVSVMTDKATVDIESPVAGVVLSITGTAGEKLPVGSDLVVLEVEGEGNAGETAPAPAAAAPAPAKAPETKPAQAKTEPAAAARVEAPRAPPQEAGKPRAAPKPGFATRAAGEKPSASPAIRQKARELGVELQFVGGTGPGGRITWDDLDGYVASGGRAQVARGGLSEKHGVEEIKVIGLRRVIAGRMQEAKRRIPHFSYIEEVDATTVDALRAHLNDRRSKDQPKLTLLPFLMRAMVRAVEAYPQVNARFLDDDGIIERHEAVHIGIATQTPAGLVVPVVRHVEGRDVWDCAAEVARLAGAARAGNAARDELSGSTITITSLGALGGVATTPVINYPEVSIVGVNKIAERPVVQNGHIVVRKMMNLSCSFDHRVVDGVDAAEFVQRIRSFLEQPATIFMD